jgi:uncharacterized protein YkwD
VPLSPQAPVTVALSGSEQALLEAHNAERLRRRAQPLAADSTLFAIARERAVEMAASGYFSHSVGGQTSFAEMRSRGFQFSAAAENIAMNTMAASQATTTAMESFLSSSSHARNLLDPIFGRVGIGAASRGGTHYFVVIFADP